MKKILEVLRFGDTDIRFNTDIPLQKLPQAVQTLPPEILMAMATTLWGGNEPAVLAMIRVLAIADLALSVNREEMISELDDASKHLASAFKRSIRDVSNQGGNIVIFGPGVPPPSADKS